MKKPPFWATFFTLTGFSILCVLGTWQLQRLAWKERLIAQLDAAYESDASIPVDMNIDFSYGSATGRVIPDKAILLGPKTKDNTVGHDLIVPLRTGNGTLLVNMGWTAAQNTTELPIHHLDRDITFTGMTRTPRWNMFTPENKPDQNQWYKPDIGEIAHAKNLENLRPVMLIAEKANYAFNNAFPNNPRVYPHNNHKQYAFFWFSMAIALTLVYVLRFIKK